MAAEIHTEQYQFVGDELKDLLRGIRTYLQQNGLKLVSVEFSQAREEEDDHISLPVSFKDTFGEEGDGFCIFRVDDDGNLIEGSIGFDSF